VSRVDRTRVLTIALAMGVAVAFADSSIVVLALPDLYGEFDTTLVGVSWVISSYNAVVAVAALVLVPLARRLRPRPTGIVGVALFAAGSAGCAAAWSLDVLIGFRCLQALGGTLLLAASLRGLAALTGSPVRAAVVWTVAGTIGAAAGPALGGVLTQLFDWRAIFVVQVPLALVALAAMTDVRVRDLAPEPRERTARPHALAADTGLGLVFGALVGALFLSVLLVITVWSLDPVVGALVVSALPAATLAVRPLARQLDTRTAALGGAALLAGGLVALALLPRISNVLVALALAFCGAGLGLAVPAMTGVALDPRGRATRSVLMTVGARHAGLVLALALIAPLLSETLSGSDDKALLAGAQVVLEGNADLRQKVPIALDLRDALDEAKKGEIPDLASPFDERGAATDSGLREMRDDLITTLESVVTRGFRSSFALSALLAVLALVPASRLRRAT
jgi:MFS family permease